jgi:large subunit ribosomal protein L23Ae
MGKAKASQDPKKTESAATPAAAAAPKTSKVAPAKKTSAGKAAPASTGAGKGAKKTTSASASGGDAEKKQHQQTKKAKAASAAKATLTSNRKKAVKVRTNVKFFRPKTLQLDSKPRYARHAVAKLNKTDRFSIIKAPVTTESAMKKVEENNTLVFLVDVRANKRQIKKAFKEAYEVDCERVNTLIRSDGQKKAYDKLTSDTDALNVANRIGIV